MDECFTYYNNNCTYIPESILNLAAKVVFEVFQNFSSCIARIAVGLLQHLQSSTNNVRIMSVF